MRKRFLTVSLVCAVAASLTLSSCIGSFNLTNKVLSWNNQVGNKFVNELVFFAFWILPVYEVTALADLVVINSIEFWSGNNPLEAGVRTIETEHGRYLLASDDHGYTVTDETTGEVSRLDFEKKTRTWSVVTPEGKKPFMTFVDKDHVEMVMPDGSRRVVELSEAGVQAYRAEAMAASLAMK